MGVSNVNDSDNNVDARGAGGGRQEGGRQEGDRVMLLGTVDSSDNNNQQSETIDGGLVEEERATSSEQVTSSSIEGNCREGTSTESPPPSPAGQTSPSHNTAAPITITASTAPKLVEATMVVDLPPPVNAVQVFIDEEEQHQPSHSVERPPQSQSERNTSSTLSSTENSPTVSNKKGTARKRNTRKWIIVVSVVIVAVVIIVLITAFVKGENKENDNGDDSNDNDIGDENSTVADNNFHSDLFDYECYASTENLLMAQMVDYIASNRTQTRDLYRICPNTTVEIGVLENPARGLFQFQDGEIPLWVIAPHTRIECGLGGHVSNNCTLAGGFIQTLFMPEVAGMDGLAFGTGIDEKTLLQEADIVLDNVTIVGLTFTGAIQSDGTFDGSSVSISQRGNVTFDGCMWRDIVSDHGLMLASVNFYQVVTGTFIPQQSITLNIVRSVFENIVYDWPIFFSWYQSINVDQCTFTNVTTTPFPEPLCLLNDNRAYGGGTDNSDERLVTFAGCANLMLCLDDSSCSISNSCIQSMEMTAQSMIFVQPSNDIIDSDRYDFYNNSVDDSSRLDCELAIVRDDNTKSCINDTTIFDFSVCHLTT